MTYLILAKSEYLLGPCSTSVAKICENMSAEEVRLKAKEILETNLKHFPDLEVSIFAGEFIPMNTDWDCVNLEELS